MSGTDQTPPLLAYDGDCGFCAYWVRYWQRLTGGRVRYAPYRELAADHPEVTGGEFAGAIQLFEAGGALQRCPGGVPGPGAGPRRERRPVAVPPTPGICPTV